MTHQRLIRLEIEPGSHIVQVPAGTPLTEAFERAGIEFAYPCGKAHFCGHCRVLFEQGAPLPSDEEERKLSFKEIEEGVRLACCVVVTEDARVRLAVEEEFRTEHILNEGIRSDVVVDPEVKKYPCELAPSTLQNPVSDWIRAIDGLPESLRKEARPTLEVLQKLPALVENAEEQKCPLTLTMRAHRVIDAYCGDSSAFHYGVAVDIGTTTIATVLVDMNSGAEIARAGCLNPQTDFGYDLISRIHAVQTDPANLKGLQSKVLTAINHLIRQMCKEKKIDLQFLGAMAVAGNTLMSHLFLGIDPTALGHAPFAGTLRAGVRLEARDLDLPLQPRAPIYVLPCIGGFVGGDIVGDILVTDLPRQSGINVMIDIGTNGEVVVANHGKLYATSSAAGPAFEGGKISCGMMARDGAADHITFDGTDFRFSTLSGRPMRGLCGSGLIEIFARSLENSLIAMNGRIARPESFDGAMPPALLKRLQPGENGGRILLAEATKQHEALYLTQADVREFQLGKGAVSAALAMVLAEEGITFNQIDRVFVAGAFGNHLNIADAMTIGLLPELPLEKVLFIGNGSLEGARCVLLNRYQRQRAEQLAEGTQWVELAHRPEFQERFAMAMMLGPTMDL